MRVEFCLSAGFDPYENLAIERSLFALAGAETSILFLWQNDDTIVIGRNQDVRAECRAEAFTAQGGRIARRDSGGGAVYHDRGNLNFSVLTPSGEPDCEYYDWLVSGLRSLGVDARFGGGNDVLMGDRKISGSAAYDDGKILCRHGTVLVHSDLKKMERYLTPERGKLLRHRVASVRARVANLAEADPTITVERVRACLIRAADAVPLSRAIPAEAVRAAREKYASAEWIFGGNR